jgi:hypothetical protein
MVWYHAEMIDFPIAELLDDSICLTWLERHLHPDGFACPHCHSPKHRLFRQQGAFPAYRCRACDGYHTLLTNTVFEKTRQRPATLVLLLRGIAKGEPIARLAPSWGCHANSCTRCVGACSASDLLACLPGHPQAVLASLCGDVRSHGQCETHHARADSSDVLG